MVNYKKLGKLLIWRCKQKKVGSQLPTATMAEIEGECKHCNRKRSFHILNAASRIISPTKFYYLKKFEN